MARYLASALVAVLFIGEACERRRGEITVVPGGAPTILAADTRIEIDTGTSSHADFHVADFDGDGVLDMAVISLTSELCVLLGNGAGFALGQQLQLSGLPIAMSGGDVDRDGDQDLVIVQSDANVTALWENDGSAGFTVRGALPTGASPRAVAVGDLDEDGNLDVAVSRPSSPDILVGFGDGAMDFAAAREIALPGGGSASNLAIGDADRDGTIDLVVADPIVSRLLVCGGGPTARLTLGDECCELPVPGAPGAVTFGDLSGDGLADLVVSAFSENRYVVITSLGPPNPQSPGTGGVPTCAYQSFDVQLVARPSLATVGDVTGDGANDLVACLAFTASVAVAPGLPGGGVGDPFLLDATGLPLRPFIGDADGNGKNDVFALSGLGDRINLWATEEDGRLRGARNYESTLPSAPFLAGADFDGDGSNDVAVGGDAASRVVIMSSGASGDLQVIASFDVGFPVFNLDAGDLDGDEKVDLVVSVEGGVKFLRNQSTPNNLQFTLVPPGQQLLVPGASPLGIAVFDLDRDGDLDLAVCDHDGGGLYVVRGTPVPFEFEPETIVNVGGGPVDVVAADFTGDGLPDLAVSRGDQSNIAILRNEGGAAFVESLAIPVGQLPNYLVSADFNRDGRSDLVVSNALSGTITVLFGNAGGLVGVDYPAGALPTALLARDLTDDDFVDILVVSLQSGDIRLLVGDGNGAFPQTPRYPGTFGATSAVVQDMNGDDDPDLLIGSQGSSRVSYLRTRIMN